MTKEELAFKIMFDLDGNVDRAVELIEQFVHQQNNKSISVQSELDIESASVITFTEFWEAYDKKIGYHKCESKWKRLPMKDKILAMKYIPGYKQSQPNKKFRKNPETFLNNKGWLDELVFTVEKKIDFSNTEYTIEK